MNDQGSASTIFEQKYGYYIFYGVGREGRRVRIQLPWFLEKLPLIFFFWKGFQAREEGPGVHP